MEAVGKAAGANSMMRELGGVFGIAVAVAVFAGAGSYASAAAFTDGFGPAIVVAAALWRSPARSPASRCPAAAGDRSRASPVPRSRPRSERASRDLRRQTVMVRYKVKPDRAAENEELVRAVYDELQRTEPAGLRYATFQLDDGVSFVHLASIETEDGHNPLSDVTAFERFQENIGDRCDEPPVVTELREIGSFRASECEHDRPPIRSSTSSCTPATCRARARSTRELLRLAPGADRQPGAAPTSRSSSAAASAAASSSAAPGARCGCPTSRSTEIDEATERARRLGASVLLEPREGPAGWRSVVATPAGGEIAFWQPKSRAR